MVENWFIDVSITILYISGFLCKSLQNLAIARGVYILSNTWHKFATVLVNCWKREIAINLVTEEHKYVGKGSCTHQVFILSIDKFVINE